MHFVANKLELLRYLNFVVSFLAAVKVKLEAGADPGGGCRGCALPLG